MKRLACLLFLIVLFSGCKEDAVDATKRVRPVNLTISFTGKEYKLTWQKQYIVCITSPCPGEDDVDADEYEVQIANDETGPFRTYSTLGAADNMLSIPVTETGAQIMARIIARAKGATTVYSKAVMATSGLLSQSAYYPGFGRETVLTGSDITPDGRQSIFIGTIEETPGKYVFPVYVASLQNEQVIATKTLTQSGGIARFSPDGQTVAYSSITDNGFVIHDLVTDQKRTLAVPDISQLRGFDWSPDGKWIAYTTISNTTSRLWKTALSGGEPVALSPALSLTEAGTIRPGDIDWSPDGQFIAVSSSRSNVASESWRAELAFYSPAGSGEIRSFEGQPGWTDIYPSFSPDGRQLAFLSSRTSVNYTLWVRDLSTRKARRIELLPGIVPADGFTPRWQGNDRLIFMATQQGKTNYFSVFL